MYDELVKRLRDAAKMSEALAVLLPHSEGNAMAKLYNDAANAVEELSKRVDESIPKDDAEIIIAEVAKPRWIPVTERLPEDDGWYLVYAPDYRGGSSSGLKCVDGKMFCKFAKGKWSIEHGYYNRPGCVTNWMPLPEPPKEE